MKANVIVGGDIFQSKLQALVCPVNTRGYMGALAGAFQTRFPEESQTYIAKCHEKQAFTVGDIHISPILNPQPSVVPGLRGVGPKWIIFFPTMVDPNSNSSTFIILMGLQNLIPLLRQLEIKSLALPALGCGVGGLEFKTVLETVDRILGPEPGLVVDLYAPLTAQATATGC